MIYKRKRHTAKQAAYLFAYIKIACFRYVLPLQYREPVHAVTPITAFGIRRHILAVKTQNGVFFKRFRRDSDVSPIVFGTFVIRLDEF